jgi:hypothetical protein
MPLELPIIIKNSPIEFIIIGPDRGHDRLLIRSENAGLDLIGLVIQSNDDDDNNYYNYSTNKLLFIDFIDFFLPKKQKLNIVSTIPMPDINPVADSRKSKLSFAWKGLTSRNSRDYIRKILNLSLPDLYKAIELRDQNEIELRIASTIFVCAQEAEKSLWNKKKIWFTILIYTIIAITLIIYPYLLSKFRLYIGSTTNW